MSMIPYDYEEFKWHGHPDLKGHTAYADYLSTYIDRYLLSD